MKRFLFTFASLCTFSLAASAQTLVRSYTGALNWRLGTACIVVSDQNADGYKDLLVGMPGYSSERGAILCLSGAFLANGTAAQTLWSLAASANQGDLFGYAIAEAGDPTNDGITDFIVGQPGYDVPGKNDVGAIRLVDGASHLAIGVLYGPTTGGSLGSALVACGDVDADGKPDVVAGAPGPLVDSGSVYRLRTNFVNTLGPISFGLIDSYTNGGNVEFGASLASADLDSDGVRDLIIGVPGRSADAGGFTLVTKHLIANYTSPFPGERFGASVDAAHDYDGDGAIDVVAGAPNALDAFGNESGRVAVFSGGRFLAQTPPYEISKLARAYSTQVFDSHFGAAVRACADLNNDGVGEILVGAPGYTSVAGFNNKGFVSVISGASGTRWAQIVGGSNDVLGDSLAGAIGDFDGDGFKEFVIAGSLSNAGGTDSGVVKCYRLFPIAPATYCVAKLNSLGCAPAIGFSGTASMSSVAPFPITCANQINQKTGLFFYSHAPTAIAFQGGTLCVSSPIKRTPLLNSGGSTSGNDCSGAFSFNFTGRIRSGIDPTLVAGAEIYCQYWSRDSGSASGTSLSNALRFAIHP